MSITRPFLGQFAKSNVAKSLQDLADFCHAIDDAPIEVDLDSPHSRLLMMIQEQLCKECIEKTTVENLVFLRLRLQTRLLRLPTEMARFQKALTRSTDVLDLPPMSCLQTVNISYECGKKL
jgi:hypothetical protein